MKIARLIQTGILFTIFFFFTALFWWNPLWGEEVKRTPLLEYYNTTDKETLVKETAEMSGKLKSLFNSEEIEATEAELDFSRYFTNFKNLIRYVSKLAGYTDYEENIQFGRDREIYQILPEEGELEEDKKSVIAEKYNRLEAIANEEILVYQDMIETSFDACEIYTDTLFWGDKIFKKPKFKETMENYFRDEMFQTYEREKKPLLEESEDYRQYANRIDRLVSLWKEPPPDPTSPIINPDVVERL